MRIEVNVDIASCFKKFYNNNKLEKMSSLEMFVAILKADYLEDISEILGSMINMKEKNKFLKQVKDMSLDKDVLDAVKLEDNIEYRFDLVREDALERGLNLGIEQGIEQNTLITIKNMLAKNMDFQDISDITGKSIDEIKKIANE